MSSDSQRPLINGNGSAANGNGAVNGNGSLNGHASSKTQAEIDKLNEQLKTAVYLPEFHGDALIGDKVRPEGTLANILNRADDFRRIFSMGNWSDIGTLAKDVLTGQSPDLGSGAKIVASMSNDSNLRAKIIESQVKAKYDRMLHPPVTYLGDAFKYRTADGSFNNALSPHLGQAGAPYAKTVPSKTHPLGALPDAGDLFDRLMAREISAEDNKSGRPSKSGLSSMLIYHATIIIHDIFRTNDKDKNISDTSSYLDLSPLYGFTNEMQRKVRDDKYKLGLLKPDTFAEDRLLRQPPGVCIMLVMYNRYHNYVATQLRRINENDKFSVPEQFVLPQLAAAAKKFVPAEKQDQPFKDLLTAYGKAWRDWKALDEKPYEEYERLKKALNDILDETLPGDDGKAKLAGFEAAWTAAWDKLDDDLFNTARLITCGQYIQVSIHDYLRALMGFHNYDTNFTLDPRINMKDKEVSRGQGNQVTVEFNLLYRFHCAISRADEDYAEDFIREAFQKVDDPTFDPKNLSLEAFMGLMQYSATAPKVEPKDVTFGLKSKPEYDFERNPITKLFDDQQMINALKKAMDEPICSFGPKNIPKCLKPIEILGIIQARKWEIGTLNDFRDFFGMERHKTFESISGDKNIQNALRDLYEHPDKVELYPGVFCESDANRGADPGPSDVDSALWAAIFSDAITLVRSDRFYTVDWNTNSLTTWGMKEVTPDNDVLKTSVFHRLLQRAFPEWFPSDSIRFFHPFYTAQKNAELAYAQGYGDGFRMTRQPDPKNTFFGPKNYIIDTKGSDPVRPSKPLLLDETSKIRALLDDDSDKIVHPARLNLAYLPAKIQEVLEPGKKTSKVVKRSPDIEGNTEVLMAYMMELMRDIVKREFIVMDEKNQIYQLDVVKDHSFAIPTITRYVADFLGVSNQIRSEKNLHAKYSENEIYQHITNCQMFLSYNADETKLLKRRQAFKTSMKFLFELTQEGHIKEANQWFLTRTLAGLFKAKKNPMEQLGFRVAQEIINNEGDFGRSAAILLLVGLDSAYNSVLAFTSVLDFFIKDLYKVAENKPDSPKNCAWQNIQKLSFVDDPKSAEDIMDIVLRTQRLSVRLPIIRKATEDYDVKDKEGRVVISVKRGQTIICDLCAAANNIGGGVTIETDETKFLNYQSSFTEKFAPYHPKHIAALSLTAMIKVLAQMKNLRRGHDGQGKVKRVYIDQSYEGYSNYMAPMRMREIELEVERQRKEAEANGDKAEIEQLSRLFSAKRVLKPRTDTYLTPEWDEMVPFPTTWKVRFDGFGVSDYGGDTLPYLQQVTLPDFMPPWYQPTGPSSTGGSFALPEVSSSKKCPASHVATSGCALPMKQ
ncbi:Fc.00g085500.m01.CDS01 [Cosmosporella sp. VM-42]